MEGITIDGVNTVDLGLELTSMSIPLPDLEEKTLEIPGMSGSLDMTEIYGYITYKNRKLKFVFTMNGTYDQWALQTQRLAEMFHGKKVKITPNNDINYYYVMRVNVSSTKNNDVFTDITISGTAEPFKYEKNNGSKDMLWDDVDFETTIFRDVLANIKIDGDTSVTVAKGQQPVCPEFVAYNLGGDLAVYWNGVYYPLPTGVTKIPQIKIGNKDVNLKFRGTGAVAILYRGAFL